MRSRVSGSIAHAFGQEGQRLEDVFLLGAFAVEEGAVVLIEGLAAAFAAEALLALAGVAEANQVAGIDLAEVGTRSIILVSKYCDSLRLVNNYM